ncbi:hypothetical protein EV424DRAFT_1347853 [Suillus variegatus]|nr:hypothetical protein EV424DRAFT_1347853 [Suillus variegatus]
MTKSQQAEFIHGGLLINLTGGTFYKVHPIVHDAWKILNEEAGRVVKKMKMKVHGQYVTGQYQPYLLNTCDISVKLETAENLLEIVLGEIMYTVEVLKVKVVAWCTDASSDSAKMWCLLVQKIPQIIVDDCWIHQLIRLTWLTTENFIEEMLVNSLEDLKTCAENRMKMKCKATETLAMLPQFDFWHNLDMVKQHLELLAVAANATQSDFTRLNVVLVKLVNLYHKFCDPLLDQAVCEVACSSLEKCWAKMDQDIFILTVVLNPSL